MIVKVNLNLGQGMKTTRGAAHNYIMSTAQVPNPRIEPKNLKKCRNFTTLPLTT